MSSAGAALVGLLFVAVSLNASRTFGSSAAPERERVAASTLTALANGFVISSWALIPGAHIGITTMIMAAVGFAQSLLLAIRLGGHELRHDGHRRSRLARLAGFSAVSLGLYGYEFGLGRQLNAGRVPFSAIVNLAGVVLIIYVLGLFRAWTLLGATRRGPAVWLNPLQDLDDTPRGVDAPAQAQNERRSTSGDKARDRRAG